MKNTYLYSSNQAVNKSYNKRMSHSLCRSIAEERLIFKDGVPLGSLPITVEDGQTKRIVRRIVEKRVCQEYWKNRKDSDAVDGKHHAATKKYMSSVTRKIFGEHISEYSYDAT